MPKPKEMILIDNELSLMIQYWQDLKKRLPDEQKLPLCNESLWINLVLFLTGSRPSDESVAYLMIRSSKRVRYMETYEKPLDNVLKEWHSWLVSGDGLNATVPGGCVWLVECQRRMRNKERTMHKSKI